MSMENISSPGSKVWIKYVVGGAILLLGVGLLFLEQTKLFAPVFIGLGVGRIL